MSEAGKLQHRNWSKDQYVISTDPSLIPVAKVNAGFTTSEMHWAIPLPPEVLRETLERSLCFGLYEKLEAGSSGQEEAPLKSSQELIGFARLVTDFVTFVYLTDVFVWPEHQGKGLGKWLITCVQDVIEGMPYLRKSLLVTSDWERSVPFYAKLMGMELVGPRSKEEGGMAVMQANGRGLPPNH